MSERIERLKAEVREAWDAKPYGVPYVRVELDVYEELAVKFPSRLSGAGLRVEGCDVSPAARLDPGTWEIEA